ncbi:flagellar hook-basal body protein [Paenibacillus protaetiae]|uniref:Flagellar hook-basal body protein n=1 Tax=Paenibacillus protaetiae TaxID=2509456 RepID=A0A4P6F0U4_9BACL|nr:flagellar hook-basal body protein [Paenibacillus protaetiae]QAY67729.1 flagellar hook-basal body protein [Paenibacillus protaetiae]
MNSSMINAMTSLGSLQQKLDVLADNIANSNTVGYKRKEASFADLLDTAYKQPDPFMKPGRMTPSGFNQGWGTRLASIQTNYEQGPLKETGVDTDLAIEGNAMFQVEAGGGHAYTRSGAFQLTSLANGDTILATEQGYPVVAQVRDTDGKLIDGRIVVPPNYKIQVAADGTVTGESPDGEQEELGRIKLMQVNRPSALSEAADNMYVVEPGMNENDVLQQAEPSADNGIAVRQRYLEQSNVDLSNEVTELINVQRAYQLAARALSSSDTMMGLANNMRA